MSDDRRRALDELAADAQALGEYDEPRRTMSNVVVLDCAHCGGEAVHDFYATGCTECRLVIYSRAPAERLAMWNRRVVVGGKPEAPGT